MNHPEEARRWKETRVNLSGTVKWAEIECSVVFTSYFSVFLIIRIIKQVIKVMCHTEYTPLLFLFLGISAHIFFPLSLAISVAVDILRRDALFSFSSSATLPHPSWSPLLYTPYTMYSPSIASIKSVIRHLLFNRLNVPLLVNIIDGKAARIACILLTVSHCAQHICCIQEAQYKSTMNRA